MHTYSLDLTYPDGPKYVGSHDFRDKMKPGDEFKLDGWTWKVTDVATKQFATDEPDETLRCVVV